MAYPSSFLTRQSFSRTRLLYSGGSEANNLNTQFDLFINLLNGNTAKDVNFQGALGAKGVYPYADALYSLGDDTYGFNALYLENGASDGGTIYFDGASSSYLQSAANGTTLGLFGFTGFNFPASGSINDVNGNELVKFPAAVTSAVNELTVSNAAQNNAPSIAATGGDTNIDVSINGKGTGDVLLSTGGINNDVYSEKWVAYNSTIVGFSGTPTQSVAYKRLGKLVVVTFNITGTSNATGFTFTVPYTSADAIFYGVAGGTDNGSDLTTPVKVGLGPSSATVTLHTNWVSGAWTASGTKAAAGQLIYEAA